MSLQTTGPMLSCETMVLQKHLRELSRINLNLLTNLAALLEHRNVTYAASSIGISQPAMSRALAQLRRVFNDDLLVRGANGLVRTAKGEDLAKLLPGTLKVIHELLSVDRLVSIERRVETRMILPDHQSLVLLPPLLRRVREEAPDLDLFTDPLPQCALDQLEHGQTDLAIGQIGEAPRGYYRRRLYTDRFACLLRSDHPALAWEWTFESFSSLRHVAVGSDCMDGFGRVHDEVARLDLGSRPILVSNLLTAGLTAVQADCALIVPRRAAVRLAHMFPLSVKEVPAELASYEVFLIWHERSNRDPRHKWLRETIAAVASDDRS
ncbi:LysR family transcriptional regulator (plasmid) [Bradyrhizobium sp. 62B]|uniref:LysR family transcriptional regulator n=1 Tax=Bradyrhizobium sp. 62B TaxID=2898442 RepID=UPI002557E52C|nr:LysR family transcriptional regulator [Bradyrhizobium sp. 62B]